IGESISPKRIQQTEDDHIIQINKILKTTERTEKDQESLQNLKAIDIMNNPEKSINDYEDGEKQVRNFDIFFSS
ncbi:34474_t:CDS:2, partial [Gigaspora margarita]